MRASLLVSSLRASLVGALCAVAVVVAPAAPQLPQAAAIQEEVAPESRAA